MSRATNTAKYGGVTDFFAGKEVQTSKTVTEKKAYYFYMNPPVTPTRGKCHVTQGVMPCLTQLVRRAVVHT